MLMPSAASNTAKYAQNGEMFARLRLTSQLSEDTSAGRLVLQNVHAVHLAPYDPTVENPTEPEVVSLIFFKSIYQYLITEIKPASVFCWAIFFDYELALDQCRTNTFSLLECCLLDMHLPLLPVVKFDFFNTTTYLTMFH